ncbi:MAG TPA: hypothetical protein VJM12_20945 [Pyrinomonadaceae bacterium]|nr:hypothetical protein [Pyrinomonadaceae bacterium]
MKKLFIPAVVLSILALGQSVSAQSSTSSPSRAAQQFYRTYLKLKINGLPNDNQLKLLSPLVTSDLKDLFLAARKIQAEYIRKHPDEKPPWADGDLFSSLFEGAQSFRIGRASVRGNRAEVPVQLKYRQGGATSSWSDVLVFERIGRQWLVSDILMKGEWAFKSGNSLRSILSSR